MAGPRRLARSVGLGAARDDADSRHCAAPCSKNGTVDKAELTEILSRGKGQHAMSTELAAKCAADIVAYYGKDGVLVQEGFVQWWRDEIKWNALSQAEKDAWFAENPEFAHTQAIGK